MTYETILLDIDGTLIDFHACEKSAFQKVCSYHNIKCNDEIYQKYSMINLKLWEQYEKGIISRETIFNTRFVKLFSDLNMNYDGITFEHIYQSLLAEEHDLIPGALEVTQYLSKKYNLYVVTNGVATTQLIKLKNTGLDKYMKNIFISETVGYQKPMKEFFDYCFERIDDIDLATTMIIGDSLTSDILGGNNAGIATCWYNPKKTKNNIEVNIDYMISNLEELYQLL